MSADGIKIIFYPAAVLALTALTGAAGLVAVKSNTIEKILYNQKQTLLNSFNQLIPAAEYDNDPASNRIELDLPAGIGGKNSTAYLAKKDGQVVAVFIELKTRRGYSGTIRLLAAVRNDLSLGGARVLEHKETPGLGDGIEIGKSPWIDSFVGKSLINPAFDKWKVKKDGGEFDQFTGATITPRAIVAAVRETLEFVAANKENIFADR